MSFARFKNTLGLIISLACILAILFMLAYSFGAFDFVTDPIENIEESFAYYTLRGEVTTVTYEIDDCIGFELFDELGREVYLMGATPSLKIVNDGGSYVEVKANKELHDMLKLESVETYSATYGEEITSLSMSLKDECFGAVYDSYERQGAYLDLTILEITVHAPISVLTVDVPVTIDYDVAPAEAVDILLYSAKGRIYNVSTVDFDLSCRGESELTVEGEVSDTADFSIMHNSKVDATGLTYDTLWESVSRSINGFCYLKVSRGIPYRVEIIGVSNIATVALIGSAIFWISNTVKLVKKREEL